MITKQPFKLGNTLSFDALVSLLALLAVALSTFHIYHSIIDSTLTYDEYNHFSWSKIAIEESRYDRDRAGYISTMPVTKINYYTEKTLNKICESYPTACISINNEWSKRRIGTALIYFMLLLGSYLLTRQLSNHTTALVSVSLISLDPSIIAHSAVVTVDVAFAAGMVFSIYSLCIFYRRTNLYSSILLGVSLGFTALSKYTTFLLLPVLITVKLVAFYKSLRTVKILDNAENSSQWQIGAPIRLLAYIILAGSISLFLISWGFNFNNVKIWLGDHPVNHPKLSILLSYVRFIPLPLPSAFITGLDSCMLTESKHTWNVILNNAWYSSGTWKYFVTLFFYKTPILNISVIILGIISFICNFRNFKNPFYIILIAQVIISLSYFSFIFSTQVGYRYTLFILPLLISLSISSLLENSFFKSKKPLIATLILSHLIIQCTYEYKPFKGIMLSYYNSLFVDKRTAYRYIADSNFDWNHTWKSFDKEKVKYDFLNPSTIQKGVNIFSANTLLGVFYNFHQYEWLRRSLEPDRVIAKTFFQFTIDDQKFEKYLNEERTYYPNIKNTLFCDNHDTLNVSDLKKSLSVKGAREEQRICINTKEESTVLSVKLGKSPAKGKYNFGIVNKFDQCDHSIISKEESLYFKLRPGLHILCYTFPEPLEIILSVE